MMARKFNNNEIVRDISKRIGKAASLSTIKDVLRLVDVFISNNLLNNLDIHIPKFGIFRTGKGKRFNYLYFKPDYYFSQLLKLKKRKTG